MIRVFTKPGCSICKGVKAKLQSMDIQYEEVDVSKQEGLELAAELGINHAGTIIDEEGNIIPLDMVKRS